MLIGILGRKGAGKDSAARILARYGFEDVKQATPIKLMLETLYDHAGVDPEFIRAKLDGPLKEVPCPILGGKTPRQAMQTLGTEWRDLIDQTLWVRIWTAKVEDLLRRGIPVCCSDIRFLHEARAARALGAHLVRVERPGLDDDRHPSEVEGDLIAVDHVIRNTGTLSDLEIEVCALLKKWT